MHVRPNCVVLFMNIKNERADFSRALRTKSHSENPP